MENVLQFIMACAALVAFAGAGYWWLMRQNSGTSDVAPPHPRPIDPDVAPVVETKKTSKKKKPVKKIKGGKRK